MNHYSLWIFLLLFLQGCLFFTKTPTNKTVSSVSSPARTGSFSVSPSDNYDFGVVNQYHTGSSVDFTVYNFGNSTKTGCSAPTISGDDSSYFSITSNSCTSTFASGVAGLCQFTVNLGTLPTNRTYYSEIEIDCSGFDDLTINLKATKAIISVSSVSINSGSYYTSSPTINIDVSLNGTPDSLCIAETNSTAGCSWDSSYLLNNPYTYTMTSSNDGFKEIFVFSQTDSTNEGPSIASFVIDSAAPSAPAVTNPTAIVTTDSAPLSWTSGADSNYSHDNLNLCLSNDCTTGCLTSVDSSSSPYTMTGIADGTYYFCAQTVDRLSQSSSWTASTSTITIDTTAGSISSFKINEGSSFTSTTAVSLSYEVTGDNITRCFSESTTDTSGCLWSADFSSPQPFTFDATPALGTRNVYLLIRDNNGNSTYHGDSIYLNSGQTLMGTASSDNLTGSYGNDTLIGRYDGDTLDGGEGDDKIYADDSLFDPKRLKRGIFWLDASKPLDTYLPYGFDIGSLENRVFDTYDASMSSNLLMPSHEQSSDISNRNLLHFDAANTQYLVVGNLDIDYTKYLNIMISSASYLKSTGTRALWGNDVWYDRFLILVNAGNTVTSTGAGFSPAEPSILNDWALFSVSISDRVTNGSFVNSYGSTVHQYTDNQGGVSLPDFYIGRIQPSSPYMFDGYLSDLIIYDETVDTDGIKQTENYLSYKNERLLTSHAFGDDTLTGGDGSDYFIWSNASHSTNDTISDFSLGEDLIYLYGFGEYFTPIGTSNFNASGDPEVRWSSGVNPTLVEVDFTGDGTADMVIKLTGDIAINEDDIRISSVKGTTATDDIWGGFGNDLLVGGHGGDTIHGEEGDDLIFGDLEEVSADQIPNIILWLDGSNPSGDGRIVSNGEISSWNSIGVGGRFANTTSDATYNPSYNNGANDTPRIYFDGAACLEISNDSVLDATEATIMTVVQTTGGTGTYRTVYDNRSNTLGPLATYGRTLYSSIADDWYYQFGTGPGWFGPRLGIVNLNEKKIFTMRESNTGDVSIDNAGIFDSSFDGVQANSISNNGVGCMVDDQFGALDFFYVGNIFDIVQFDKQLNDTQKRYFEQYLSLKNGTSLVNSQFAPDHLYGGTGRDIFGFSPATYSGRTPDTRDIIYDFSLTEGDMIMFSGFPSELTFQSGGNGALDLTGSIRQISYENLSGASCSTGNSPCTVVYVDTDGDNYDEWQIELTGTISLTQYQFATRETIATLKSNVLKLDATYAHNGIANTTGYTSYDSTFDDLSPSENHATLSGFSDATGATSGFIGDGSVSSPYALRFDGLDDKVTLGTNIHVDYFTPFSFGGWFNFGTVVNSGVMIGQREGQNAAKPGFSLSLNSDGTLEFYLGNNAATSNCIDFRTTSSFNDGNWHLIIATYDGGNTLTSSKIYVDGVLASGTRSCTTPLTGVSFQQNVTFNVGSIYNATASDYFGGDISKVQFYRKDLSDSEIEIKRQCFLEELNFTSSVGNICN